MLLNYMLELNSPVVAILVSVGVAVVAAVIVALVVWFFRKKKAEDEAKDKKEEKPVYVKPEPKSAEEIQKEKEEKAQKREENKKKEVTSRIRKTSELGIEMSPECFIKEDPNGTEAVGIIFNRNSKTYMFGPKGNKLNIGDVVIVKDLSGTERMVPVVVPNRMVNDNDLVKPFKDIERVVYQTEKHVEYTAKEKEEVVEEKVELPTFKVTFDIQGNGEAPENLEGIRELPYDLPVLSSPGFRFMGWTLDPNTFDLVEDGMKLDKDITLYAYWVEATYHVTFVTNGHGEAVEALDDVTALPEPLPVLNAEGFVFKGWSLNKEGTEAVQAGLKLRNDIIIYAVWEELPKEEVIPTYSITFDTLGKGEAVEAIKDVTEIPTELPLTTCEGYEFGGWALEAYSTELVELGSKLDKDVTLYAIWEEVKQPEPEPVNEPQEEVQEEVADDDDTSDEKENDTEVIYNAETHTYTVIRRKKSFEGRLCIASKENKGFYNQVKNKLMSYGLTNRISKSGEKFRLKRQLLAQIKFTAKQMVIYLALDPKQFEETKYKGKDVSDKKLYVDIPFQYKTRTERKTMWMLELVDLLAEKHNLVKNEKYEDMDYTKDYPYMSEEKLIEKGYLVITEKTVTEVVEEPEEENEE